MKTARRFTDADVRRFERLLLLAQVAGSNEVLNQIERVEFRDSLIAGELPSSLLQRLVAPELEPLLSEAERAAVERALKLKAEQAARSKSGMLARLSLLWRFPVVVVAHLRRMRAWMRSA